MTAAATKLDIKLLMDEIGKLYDANQQWKEELKLHFDTAVEHFKADIRTINSEEIGSLKGRVTCLEVHTGLIKAA